MLLSFSVTNFLSIQQTQTLSLVGTKLKGPHEPMPVLVQGGDNGVLPCVVIYGPNAAGKSNFIIAIHLMRRLVQQSYLVHKTDKKLPYQPFQLGDAAEPAPTTLEISFMKDGVRYDYGFSFDSKEFIEEWLYSFPEGRRRKIFERDRNYIGFGSGMRGAKKSLANFTRSDALFVSTAAHNNHSQMKEIFEYFGSMYFCNQVNFSEHLINSTFGEDEIDGRAIKFLELIGTGIVNYSQVEVDVPQSQKDMMKDLFGLIKKHVASEDESGLEFPEPDEKEYKVRLAHRDVSGREVYFNIEQESMGTRRLLVILNYIFKVLDDGDLAVIDEIDAGLHTFAVEAIIDLFVDPEINKNGAQLVATAHDTNILSPNKLRRDEIWFVEKTPPGSSEYFSLAEINSRHDESFESLYLTGRYGALPQKPHKVFFKK